MMRRAEYFALIVPDLRGRAQRYLDGSTNDDPGSGVHFIRETYLGRETRSRTLPQIVRRSFGNADHLWMWDEPSMTAALQKVGFSAVRRCTLGDAVDPAFAAVESADRFRDSETGDIEIAMEATKPDNSLRA